MTKKSEEHVDYDSVPDCPKYGKNFAKHNSKICDVIMCWDNDDEGIGL